MGKQKPRHGSPSTSRNPQAHPDAPAGGGGPGRFRVEKSPGPLGSKNPSWWPTPSEIARRRREADPRYFEEVPKGTREYIEDKDQNVRILVERQKDGLYHWLIETLDGEQMCEGVYDPQSKFTGFSAEQCIDKTSDVALEALEEEVEIFKKRAEKEPPEKKNVKREVIVIVKEDWLSKISLKRWGDMHAWMRYLKETDKTLKDRQQRGEVFDPDHIYPGDTFEVIGGWR